MIKKNHHHRSKRIAIKDEKDPAQIKKKTKQKTALVKKNQLKSHRTVTDQKELPQGPYP